MFGQQTADDKLQTQSEQFSKRFLAETGTSLCHYGKKICYLRVSIVVHLVCYILVKN